jgi:hypothetical protein
VFFLVPFASLSMKKKDSLWPLHSASPCPEVHRVSSVPSMPSCSFPLEAPWFLISLLTSAPIWPPPLTFSLSSNPSCTLLAIHHTLHKASSGSPSPRCEIQALWQPFLRSPHPAHLSPFVFKSLKLVTLECWDHPPDLMDALGFYLLFLL